MANDIICEMSSAGEIVVVITGMTYQSVAAELAGKASVEDVALKADKTYVDSQDLLKADITYVDSQDALKADKTYVDTQDALKADITYVDSQDALKADLTDIGLLEASLSENKIYQAVKDSSDDTLLDSSGNIIEGTVIFVNAQEAYDLKARISILETLVMSIFSEMSPNQIAVLFSMIGATNVNVSLLETHAILDSDY